MKEINKYVKTLTNSSEIPTIEHDYNSCLAKLDNIINQLELLDYGKLLFEEINSKEKFKRKYEQNKLVAKKLLENENQWTFEQWREYRSRLDYIDRMRNEKFKELLICIE